MSIAARFRLRLDDFHLEVDLDLPGRGVTSLFGPSGCGKTSLLRAFAGLDHHAEGYLRVGGRLWQDGRFFLPPHRRPIGYVFQEASLFEHLDVRGNIEFGAKRLPPSERRVSLENAIELLDVGRLLDRRPASLSGGERQRVGISRALMQQPDLLLVDEPTASLDPKTSRQIMRLLVELAHEHGAPALVTIHDVGLAQSFADRIIGLSAGQMVFDGSPRQLTAEVLTKIYGEEDWSTTIRKIEEDRDPDTKQKTSKRNDRITRETAAG